MNEEIINSENLKDIITNTKVFIAFQYSKEARWRDIVCDIYKYMNKSFFISTPNEYNRKCGWYVKYEEVKPLLADIHKKILGESNYKDIAYMMDKYNYIIEHINLEVKKKIHTLKLCANNSCIFHIQGKCCNSNQESTEANDPICKGFIRSDYYEVLRDLRKKAESKIQDMGINELNEFLGESK